jgi:hypothetical protein
MTLDCPLDCEFLREARKHERPVEVNPDEFPNQDIRLNETFLRDHELLLLAVGRAVLEAALETPGAVDYDVRDALAALIRTQRTLESGLYYETRPDNAVAAELCRRIHQDVAEFRRAETEQSQMTKTRDTDVLGVFCSGWKSIAITAANGAAHSSIFCVNSFRLVRANPGQPPRHPSSFRSVLL